MANKLKIVLAFSLFFTAVLACDYLPTPAPEEDSADIIATYVSATQTAQAGDPPVVETEEPSPETSPFLQIVYVKDGDVWYWDEDGTHIALTAVGDAVQAYLSPDGQVVGFIREIDYDNQEIYAVNTDGTNLRPLVTLADFATMVSHPDAISAVPYRVTWVPGTHILAYNTRLTFEGPGLVLPDELRQVDADALVLTVLIPPGQAGDFYYSPDGSQIALVNGTQISVVDADGSNRRDLLTYPGIITYSEYIYYPAVVWSQDSSYLRAAIPPNDPLADPPQVTTIWHLPTDGSPASTLSTLVSVPFFHEIVTISPELSRISYLTMVTPGAPPIVDLHVSNIDGSSDVIYDSGDRRFEAWSTDGEHFIFTEGGHNPRIGRIGYPALDITGVTLMVDINWVDETQFLYLNRLSGSWELWLRELGTPGSLLTSTTGESIRYDFVK